MVDGIGVTAGPGQVSNRQNQPRMKFIVGNWPGTSRALVKYPGESLGLGIYSKPMRSIQKSVSEPIRVIPNNSEASFNPYQSEADWKSIRMNTTNPNKSKLSIRINSKLTGFIRIEISDLFGLKIVNSDCELSEISMLLRIPLKNGQKRSGMPGRFRTSLHVGNITKPAWRFWRVSCRIARRVPITTRAIHPDLDQFPGSISTRGMCVFFSERVTSKYIQKFHAYTFFVQ